MTKLQTMIPPQIVLTGNFTETMLRSLRFINDLHKVSFYLLTKKHINYFPTVVRHIRTSSALNLREGSIAVLLQNSSFVLLYIQPHCIHTKSQPV